MSASDYATLLWLWSALWPVVAVVIVVTGDLTKNADDEEVTTPAGALSENALRVVRPRRHELRGSPH